LIDIGVNLTNSRFDKDRDSVIARAKCAEITAMLVTGTNIAESHKASTLCQKYPNYLFCTAGVHPHDADNVTSDYLEQLRALASNNEVKAIGECGLDFNRNFSKPAQQEKVFTEQLVLASELGLPVFLHQRDAFDKWMNILSPFLNDLPFAISHCFTGSESELKQCLENDVYIGITGWICDVKRGQGLRDIVRHIPLDKLLIETDAPYLTPKNIKPRPKSSRNEPSYLPYIVNVLSECMSVSESAIIEHSTNNAKLVFGLPQ